jgi:cbb3-type cytochrome oxidase subunit 3
MDQQQTFNVTNDFLSGFTTIFIKLVFLIILVYLIVLLMNFLRDKFINRVTDTKKEDIADLLIILNKLFFISGFGFIIANIIQFLFNQTTNHNHNAMMNFGGQWDYLAFGIILIFVGIGFQNANKAIRNNRIE